jgi:hypothetical protein
MKKELIDRICKRHVSEFKFLEQILEEELPDFNPNRIDEERFKELWGNKSLGYNGSMVQQVIQEYNSTLPSPLIPLPKEMPAWFNDIDVDNEDYIIWEKIVQHYGTPSNNLQPLPKDMPKDVFKQLDPILKKKIQKNNQLDLFAENTRLTNINYGSPLQITRILHLLGFDVTDSNDRTLQKIAKKHEFCEVLQDYRGIKTIVERYGREFTGYINKHTNRVHTDFWQVLSTGRISSGNDDMNAPNIQNIPRDNLFRNCFEARPGFKWISIDYSSQELRLMADGSGEEGFINVLNRGEDLHCYAGSMMFKRTITKADSELRNKAKTINFGKPLTLAA